MEQKYIPLKLKRTQNNPNWFNREIKDMIHRRDKAHKENTRNPTEITKKITNTLNVKSSEILKQLNVIMKNQLQITVKGVPNDFLVIYHAKNQ